MTVRERRPVETRSGAGGIDAAAYLASFDQGAAPGLTVSVLHQGVRAFDWQCGLADLEAGRPWRDDTPAHIASHSKSMTAFVLLCLARQGVLDLDAPIGELLADLPSAWRPVTLRQCLGNVSGLAFDEQLAWMLGRDWRTPTSCQWLAETAAAVRPLHRPGAAYLYNDTNFRLAVRVAEQASGQRFESLLEQWIFAPRGMADSGFDRRGASARAGKAATYQCSASGYLRHLPYMELSGDGAVISTMRDLRAWAGWLLAASRNGDEMLAAMRRPATLPGGRASVYGLGTMLGRHRGVDWFGHSGGGAGYSMVWIAPDADLAVVVLANRSDVDPTLIALRVADQWLDAAQPASPRAAFAASGVAAGSIGDHVDPDSGISARLEQHGDVIRIDALGDFGFLRRDASGAFVTTEARLSCRLSDKANRLRLDIDGRTLALAPTVWRPADRSGFADLSGRYWAAELGAVLDIAESGDGMQLRVAGGPDDGWRFDLERCDLADVLRAGPLALKVERGESMLRVNGRGLPAMDFVRIGRR